MNTANEVPRGEGEGMRKVMYSVAASLDGYIAGPGGEFDWIPEEPAIDWNAFMDRFDTTIMGRKTYEITLEAGAEGGPPPLPTYVFTSTLTETPDAHVTLVSSEPADTVRALKKEPGKTIWLLGGGMLFAHLLAHGLVDQVEVAVVPILLGGGIPLLPESNRRIGLQLQGSQSYPGGITLLTYDVLT